MKTFALFTGLLFSIYLLTTPELYAGPGGKGASPGWQKGDKGGWKSDRPPGQEKRQEHKIRQKEPRERPEGWDRGRKEGWDSDRPPGQTDKSGREAGGKEWRMIKDRLPWLEEQ